MKNCIKSGAAEYCHYLIFGQEICPKTGRLHFQGYAELIDIKAVSKIQQLIFAGEKVHIEGRKGTQAAAIKYCKKDGDFIEFGEKVAPNQGKRTDLQIVKDCVTENGMMGVLQENFNLQAIRVAEKYIEYLPTRPWNQKTYVRWIYGPSGLGKTSLAIKFLGQDCFVKNGSTKWWVGYERQKKVLIDDLRDKFFPFVDLLNVMYRGPYHVEVKGGHRSFIADELVITSVKNPDAMYEGEGEEMFQLMRRIDQVINIEQYIEFAPTEEIVEDAFGEDTQETMEDTSEDELIEKNQDKALGQ